MEVTLALRHSVSVYSKAGRGLGRFSVLIKFLWYEQVCPNIHLMPSGGKLISAQNYFQVIALIRELIVREVHVRNAVGSGRPPCKPYRGVGQLRTTLI